MCGGKYACIVIISGYKSICEIQLEQKKIYSLKEVIVLYQNQQRFTYLEELGTTS